MMKKIIIWSNAFLLAGFVGSCQPAKDQLIFSKNTCFETKLKDIKDKDLYKQVLTQFKDTFDIMKSDKEHFGVPEYVENKIDNAVFFGKDSSECMLVVLQKSTDKESIFGSARMVRGKLISPGKWGFSVSMNFYFEKDYFKLYKENSFENISKLARYSVLASGDVAINGCEIDDQYWFVHMK